MKTILLFVGAITYVIMLICGAIIFAWTSANDFSGKSAIFAIAYIFISILLSFKSIHFLPYSIFIPVSCALMVRTPVEKALLYGPAILITALAASHLSSRFLHRLTRKNQKSPRSKGAALPFD